jgi:choline dehydrogenase-like flavoprotein
VRRNALGRLERAVLARFAEALLPASEGLAGAEGPYGVAVASPVSAFLAGAPARIRLGARLALLVLELTTFPRRFSQLSLTDRTAHLERLASLPSGVRHEIFVLLKTLSALAYGREPEVQRAVGVEARCAVGNGKEAPPRGQPSLDPLAMSPGDRVERCDVVIVGSGAGGAAAARLLAEAGLAVIVVEEGDYHDAGTYSTDPFAALSRLYRAGGLTVCEGRPAIPLPVGRCVGGTTVINSGTCFRTPDDVLRRWRDELGIGWATDLEPEFEQLERDLAVKEVQPAAAGRNGQLCRAGAEAIGASNGPIARNAGDVVCCGTCPTGCALDAKQAVHVSELPRAVAAGCLVRAGARVERVLVERERAIGVRCRTQRGAYEVHARAVVLAAGALGTPELLLAQGIANSSGEVGRSLRIHPACWVGARFDEPVRGWDGVMQSWYVDEWRKRGLFLEATFTPFSFGLHWLPGTGAGFKERIERYDRLAIIGVHMSDHSSSGRVRVTRGGLRLGYRLSERDAADIRFGIARAADIHFAAGAREVYPQVGGIASIGPGEREVIERGRSRARDLRLEAFHPMGTARMAADRNRAVVAPTGQTHDVERLYVVDASILPTSLGVNPMLTIMACARRISAGLAERLS